MILQEVPLDFQLDMSHIQDLKKKKKTSVYNSQTQEYF